jgi:hypothetical protein
VNGFDGWRKWDFVTESQVSATNYTHICEHKGALFLVDKADPTKIVYTEFLSYEEVLSTSIIYADRPKSGDPITALIPLNGYLLIFTLNNKFIISGDDQATYAIEEAPDQKGTYTQETAVADKNFVYFLSDDGVYRSNGSEPQLMSEGNYHDILVLSNRPSACIAINEGRLYLWFQSAGSNVNDSCYVWNLNYGSGSADCLESQDTHAYVARAVSAFQDDDALLVGSSMLGQAYWQEDAGNDYTNLGGDIDLLLQSHYMVGSSPAVLKQHRYWEPRFGSKSDNYTIRCEYATDQRDNWQLVTGGSVSVQGSGSLWGSAIWGSFTWGRSAEVQANLYIPGEYRRTAIRYKHYATRQPQKFLGHTLVTQTRRLR